jgi:hypothetical protein
MYESAHLAGTRLYLDAVFPPATYSRLQARENMKLSAWLMTWVCLCLNFVSSRSMALKPLISWPVEWLNNLGRNEVAAVVPRTLQDLQRVCTMCESHRQCARDLGRDPADQAWENYCPNAAVLKMLNGLPWVARSEW